MNNLQFTKKIKALCEKRRIPIAKMLSDCNLPKSFIYDVEKRNTAPSIEKLEKISKYFKVTVDYLIGNEGTLSPLPTEKMVVLNTFDNIVLLLKQQNKKQKDLTDYLGITKNAFTDWKSGRIKSYQKYLPEIATFFGVTVDYLVGNDTNVSAPIVEKDEIIFNRNGEVIKKKFTKEQMEYLEKFIRSISDDKSEL